MIFIAWEGITALVSTAIAVRKILDD